MNETVTKGTEDISADANLEADDWETKKIGFLAKRILSSVMARKETEGANAVAPSVSYAQAVREEGWKTVSNGKGVGGAVEAVPARCLPIAKTQHTPIAEVSLGTKDRVKRRSAGL